MVNCGGRNIDIDVLMRSDSVVRHFGDKELLVKQVCTSLIKLLSTFMSLLGSVNLQCNCMSSAYE